jgi:hypothetical protein
MVPFFFAVVCSVVEGANYNVGAEKGHKKLPLEG